MAKSVQTEHVFLLERLEGFGLDFLPIVLLILELFAGIRRLLLLILLRLLMFSLQLVLLFLLLQYGLIIFDCLFKRLIKETAIIDKGHGHIATETRDFLKVHFIFTDYLLHKTMLESVYDVINVFFVILFLLTSCLRYSLFILGLKDLMGDRCLFSGEHNVDHKFVARARMHEFDHFWSLNVLVSCVIRIVLDFFGGVDELANVDALSLGFPLDKVN